MTLNISLIDLAMGMATLAWMVINVGLVAWLRLSARVMSTASQDQYSAIKRLVLIGNINRAIKLCDGDASALSRAAKMLLVKAQGDEECLARAKETALREIEGGVRAIERSRLGPLTLGISKLGTAACIWALSPGWAIVVGLLASLVVASFIPAATTKIAGDLEANDRFIHDLYDTLIEQRSAKALASSE